MRPPNVVLLGGVPAAVFAVAARLSPWLIVVVVVAALILGLVQAVVPQHSEDRLRLLLSLLRPTGTHLDDPDSGASHTRTANPAVPEMLDGERPQPDKRAIPSDRRQGIPSRRSGARARASAESTHQR
jgi:hypothetical protein